MSTHYQTLGVPEDADAETIKKAWREIAFIWHPDRGEARPHITEEEAEDNFKEARGAWEVLGDPHERAAYDRELREERNPRRSVRDQGFGPPAWFRQQVAQRMAHEQAARRQEQLRKWRAELRRKAQEERRAMEQDRAASSQQRRVEMQHDYLDRIVRNLRGEIAAFILDD